MPPHLNSPGGDGSGVPPPGPAAIPEFILHEAVCGGTDAEIQHVIAMLVARGAMEHFVSSEPDGLTPLHLAAGTGSPGVVRMLLAAAPRAADMGDAMGRTPLWIAAREGRAEAIRLLLGSAFPGNRGDSVGHVPLHAAAMGGHAEAVRVLLDPEVVALADAAPGDEEGTTPLHLAAHFGSAGVVRALLERMPAAGVLSRNTNGFTPLHCAASSGHTEVVRLLLAAGADRDPRDQRGYKALHLAAACGHVAAAEALLDGLPPQNAKAEVAALMRIPEISARVKALPEMRRAFSTTTRAASEQAEHE